MFCKNCGKTLIGSPEICPDCGARPLAANAFCQNCGAAITPMTEICVKCGARVAGGQLAGISAKSRLATVLLAFFLGSFGAHRFYIGKTGSAVAMLVITIVGMITAVFIVGFALLAVTGIWGFVDFIIAIVGGMKDNEGKPIKTW